VDEPPGASVSRRYAISWKRQELDLTELARRLVKLKEKRFFGKAEV